jgi:hypothetical protein
MDMGIPDGQISNILRNIRTDVGLGDLQIATMIGITLGEDSKGIKHRIAEMVSKS